MRQIKDLEELLLPQGRFWYVGQPYSKYRDGLEVAHLCAVEISTAFSEAKIRHYSPIAATHEWGVEAGIDLRDHDFWMSVCRPWMTQAHGLVVVQMDGWQESKGLSDERLYFGDAGKPIVALHPDVVAMVERF